MIISQTPFRVSFFGGGTDFEGFFRSHGGATLVTSIDQYCYLSIHELGPLYPHRFRASYARTESVATPQKFQHPLIRECLLHLDIRDGLEITHIADLPGRTGLGSSSSFTVGLLNVLHAFRGDEVDAGSLAREAIHIERERVGDAGGWQDQYAAAHGGILRLDFRPDGAVDVKRLALSAATRDSLEARLMIFYTGLQEHSHCLADRQANRTEENLGELKRMSGMVDQAEEILVKGGELDAFGELLHESWQLKRSLAAGISSDAIDDAYEAARCAGALGGKILGAGGRGFLLVYAGPGDHAKIRESLAPFPCVPFRLGGSGSQIIFGSDGGPR